MKGEISPVRVSGPRSSGLVHQARLAIGGRERKRELRGGATEGTGRKFIPKRDFSE